MLPDSVSPASRVLVEAAVGGRVAARGLTDAAGAFSLAVPADSAVEIRALRPGMQPVRTGPFRLAPGETRTVRVVLEDTPVRLQAAAVRSERVCGPSENADAWTAWEQARVVLATTLLNEQDPALRLRTVEYEGWTTPASAVIVRDSSIREVPVEPPPSAALHDSLFERGFVWPARDGTRYFMPDATLLTDHRFAERYCLRLADPTTVPEGFLGLEFEPQRRIRGTTTGVAGTMLLDARGLLLRQIDFTYTDAPRGHDVEGAGGYLIFTQLDSGHWILNEWMLRMPSLVVRAGAMQRFRRDDGSYFMARNGVIPLEGYPVVGSNELWARARIVLEAELGGRRLLHDAQGEALADRALPRPRP